MFFQITSQVVSASRARPYRFHPFHIHCWYFLRYIIFIFSHHMGIPCNAALCDIMIGLTIVALQNISFLIRSFLILRLIHLKILSSMVFILWRSALCNASHLLPYYYWSDGSFIQFVFRPNLLFTHSYTSSMLILSCCRHLYLTSSGCFRCW